MDQELSDSKSGTKADEICQELPDKTTIPLIQHESAVAVSNNCCKRKNSCGKMDKVENKIKFPESREVTLEEREEGKDEKIKKEEEVDSRTWPTSGEILKNSRIKSKSVTDVSCHLTPVKSKHKSLVELNKLQTDQGSSENLSTFSSVTELNDKLVQESEKRRKATELVEELQNQYSDLLTRYADAANTIDEMRLGASSVPLLSSRNGSQTFTNNINFCRPLVTSTPLHSALLANQDSRNEGCMKSGFHGNSESKKFQQGGNHDLESPKYVSKAESIKITLLKEASNLEKMINSLETLLEQNQLTHKEQKKFFEKVCTEQNKQRRQYLRIKEEFVIKGAANGNAFDEDKELEGCLFDLQMRFDELEEKYQNVQDNLKEPFQSGDCCSPVDSLDGTKESENVPEDGIMNDSYEARKEKFLVQYNVLMDKYWQLKLSGTLDDGDQEMKEITEKLRQIKKELCQNEEHQHQQHQRECNIHKAGMDSDILAEMVIAKKITVEGETQENLVLKNESNRNFRVSRCLPEVPENKTGTRNKKCDEVSSTTSVPDSGISDVWNLSLPSKHSRQSMSGLLPLTKFTDTNKEHPISNPEVVSKQTDAMSLNRTGQATPMDTTSRARSNQTVPMAVEPAARTDHSTTSTDKGTLVRNDPCTMSTNQELMSRVNQQQHVQSSLVLPKRSQHHLTSDAGVQSQHSFVTKQKAKEKQTNEEENEEEEGSKLWQPKMAKSTTASKMVSTSELLSESSSSIESTEDGATQTSDPHSSGRRSRITSQPSSKFRRNSDVVFCKKTRNASKKFSIESAQDGTKSVVGSPKRSTSMSRSTTQDTEKKDPIPTFIKTSPNRKKLQALQQEIEFLKETFNRRISQRNPKFEKAEINDSSAENWQPLITQHQFSSTTSADNPQNPYIPTQINKSAKYPPRHPVFNSNASSNPQTTTFFTDAPTLNLAKYDIERNSQMSRSPDHCGTTGVYQIKPQQPKSMIRTMMTPAPNLVNTPYYTPNGVYHGIYKEHQPSPRVQAISCNKSSQFQQRIDHYNDGTQPLTNHRSSSRVPAPMMDSFKENIQYGPGRLEPAS
ncbi:uncharacterized protein LOC115231370 [Octopus sinensis]|uniref:Uncharacterized protein LOC115231370 n=1 Tax=Octopus sinensis TaxID=2607531 RepID=A0A7E6EKS6_9MOLL|nr:uncharacterized protein LOC115231370 [Octopus sinensis]